MHAEDVALDAIADAVGTPVYVYSSATLRRHYRVFAEALAGADALVAYSVKANSNLAVLSLLRGCGAGADVVSKGELLRARQAGVPGEKIVFSGVGKTAEELALALDVGVFQVNVESEAELALLARVAAEKGVRARFAIRTNPDVAAGGHAKISTGYKGAKFGVSWEETPRLYAEARVTPSLQAVGVDLHIGSQIGDLAPFERAFSKAAALYQDLRAAGDAMEAIDFGGGLGIPYAEGDAPAPPREFGAMVKRVTKGVPAKLIFEPGRMIAGNAGILLTTVLLEKSAGDRRVTVVDAAMNDLIRPALYDATHGVEAVRPRPGDASPADLVGPVCETGDIFARGRALPPLTAGDRLAIMSAGAYGAVQASQYNSRPLVPEVLVDGARWAVVRRRPTYDEMTALEAVPEWAAPNFGPTEDVADAL